MQRLHLKLPETDYTIDIGESIVEAQLPSFLSQCSPLPSQVVVVTNTTLQELYPSFIEKTLVSLGVPIRTCVLPDGEVYKNLSTLNLIFDFLLEHHADRKTWLVAFGGGVVGDMTGFAAACFMRGIPYVQVPTTLLAQVDSSVGGKTGVNHSLGKNAIGAFKQPRYVVMDLKFLQTLDMRERIAGYFELIKHGLVQDISLFTMLCQYPQLLELNDLQILESLIYQSCQVKASIVEQDEKESGIRALLNFGHTLGHLIETHAGYGRYLHGEAVGTGMLFAGYISWKEGYLNADAWKVLQEGLKPWLTPMALPALDERLFCEHLLHDKKSDEQTLTLVLLNRIGGGFLQKNVKPTQIWRHFQSFVEEYGDFLCLST